MDLFFTQDLGSKLLFKAYHYGGKRSNFGGGQGLNQGLFNPGYTWKKELSLWWEVSPPYCNSNTGFKKNASILKNYYEGNTLTIRRGLRRKPL
jgi:hypothetical protein